MNPKHIKEYCAKTMVSHMHYRDDEIKELLVVAARAGYVRCKNCKTYQSLVYHKTCMECKQDFCCKKCTDKFIRALNPNVTAKRKEELDAFYFVRICDPCMVKLCKRCFEDKKSKCVCYKTREKSKRVVKKPKLFNPSAYSKGASL